MVSRCRAESNRSEHMLWCTLWLKWDRECSVTMARFRGGAKNSVTTSCLPLRANARKCGVSIMIRKSLRHWLNEDAYERTVSRVPWRLFWMLTRKHINATNPDQWHTMGYTRLRLIPAMVKTSHWINFGVSVSSGIDNTWRTTKLEVSPF